MKIYEIKFHAYEFLEADGVGIRENSCGFTHSLDVAINWKSQSPNYRRYVNKTVHHRYVISESVEDFDNIARDALVARATAKLSKEELNALISSVQNKA
jgi:hypothetical protein